MAHQPWASPDELGVPMGTCLVGQRLGIRECGSATAAGVLQWRAAYRSPRYAL